MFVFVYNTIIHFRALLICGGNVLSAVMRYGVLICLVNGRDEAEHVDTPRPMQHKSVAPSGVSASHNVRSSASVVHAASSSKPRSRQPASTDVSSTAVGPASSPQPRLSRVETPSDAVRMASSHGLQRETDQSQVEESLKPHRGDPSRHKSNVQSSVKTSVTPESPTSVTTSQSEHQSRPKTPRLAVCDNSS